MRSKILSFASIVLLFQLMGVSAYMTYDALEVCNRAQPLQINGGSSPAIILKLPSGWYGPSALKCSIQITVPSAYTTNYGIVTYIKSIDLKSNFLECADYIDITYDDFRHTNHLCNENQKTYVSTPPISKPVLVEFYLDASSRIRSFEIVLSMYRKGLCYSSEFDCDSLFRCVWGGFACDGYDNCGDNTDERCYSTVGAIVGGVIGCLIFIGVVVVIVYLCRRRQSPGHIISPQPMVVPPATVYSPQGPPPTYYPQGFPYQQLQNDQQQQVYQQPSYAQPPYPPN